MKNRFLEILDSDEVCVNFVSRIWRVEIPAHLLNSDESKKLEQKWGMPQGDNGTHSRNLLNQQSIKNGFPPKHRR